MGTILEGDPSFSGDVERVTQALQRSRSSMMSVLQLMEVPEIDGEETDIQRHMQVQELAT